MPVKTFTLLLGAAYGLLGVLGFIPGLVTPPEPGAPPLAIDAGYGYLFGLFPINLLHNLVHVVTGALGIIAAQRSDWARTYCRAVAAVFGLLTIMGLIPGLNTTLGLVPIFSHDVWLHAILSLSAAYFGWRTPARGVDEVSGDYRAAA